MLAKLRKILNNISEYTLTANSIRKAKIFFNKIKENHGSIYIVCPHGIGDTIFLASLISEFKMHYGINEVILIVKSSHKDIPDMFDAVDGKIVNDAIVKDLTIYARKCRVFSNDNWRFGHFILDFNWPEPGQLLGVRGINLLDIYRVNVLNIPPDCRLKYPNIFVSQKQFQNMICKYQSNQKTILLMPFAATIQTITLNLWLMLAKKSLEKGYNVYTNVRGNDEQPIPGTEPLCIPLKDLFIISRALDWKCVSIRSGICDLLAFSDVSLTVLYENEALLTGWNMSGLGLPNPNIKDVLLPPDLENSTELERIVNEILKDT